DKPPILVSAAEDNADPVTRQKSGDVRVWNVDNEQMLGALTTLPQRSARLRVPGLAAFHIGDRPNQVRVAIAWGDIHTNAMEQKRGYLRVWDVDRPPRNLLELEDGYQNTTLGQLPGATAVLSASFAMSQSQLKTWDVAAKPTQLREKILPAPPNS